MSTPSTDSLPAIAPANLRSFKGIVSDDISEFESYMPSHAVGLPQVRSPMGNLRAQGRAFMLSLPRPTVPGSSRLSFRLPARGKKRRFFKHRRGILMAPAMRSAPQQVSGFSEPERWFSSAKRRLKRRGRRHKTPALAMRSRQPAKPDCKRVRDDRLPILAWKLDGGTPSWTSRRIARLAPP
jgi:hypothetical protein